MEMHKTKTEFTVSKETNSNLAGYGEYNPPKLMRRTMNFAHLASPCMRRLSQMETVCP